METLRMEVAGDWDILAKPLHATWACSATTPSVPTGAGIRRPCGRIPWPGKVMKHTEQVDRKPQLGEYLVAQFRNPTTRISSQSGGRHSSFVTSWNSASI